MNPPSSSELGPKSPESLWLQHKDIFHRLYIIENKTLSLVKQIMEDEHQFPTQRLCDYEVALRETLKFRKNLKQEEWHAIGVHISNRKRQAKESEVIWNGTRLEAKKVRKDVLRNSRLRQYCIRTCKLALIAFSVAIIQHILDVCLPKSAATLELPHGLVIRTPPGSPIASVPVLRRSSKAETAHAESCLSGGEGGNLHINPASVFDETIEEVIQLACAEARVEAALFGISPIRKLCESLPFKRFMLRLWNLAQSRPVHMPIPPGQAWTLAPRLFGANPSWDLIGHYVFDLSNEIYQDWAFDKNDWFLNWISISADVAMLRAFFSINSPTVGAVYEQLRIISGNLKMPDLLRLLFELKDSLRVNNSTSVNEADFVSTAVGIGSRSDGMLDIVRICESNTPSLATTELHQQWGKPSSLVAASRCDIAILQVLVAAGWDINTTYPSFDGELMGQIMSRIYSWTPQEEKGLTVFLDVLIRGGILDVSWSPQRIDDHRTEVAIGDIYSITWDELVMVCPPIMRKTLHSIFVGLTGGQGTCVSKAGVFTAAQDGVLGLRAYLETYTQADSLLTHAILEESLLFAAILNDQTTASVLLQVGVDPDVGRSSNNLEHYYKGNLPWNPSIFAAAAGSLEVLTLLVSKIDIASFLDSVPIYEIVQPSSPEDRSDNSQRELQRLENLRRSYLYAQKRSSQSSVESIPEWSQDFLRQWDFFKFSEQRFESLQFIRSIAKAYGYGQDIDLNIIKAAVLKSGNRRWVRRYNRHLPCEVLLMEGLVDANLNYEEGGMDLLHLSIRNHCSLKIARFLLGKGFKVHSRPAAQSCHSMLHDALLSQSPDRLEIVELLLLEGADCNIRGEGLTILEASLWTIPNDSNDVSQDLDIFKRLFKAGAPVYHWPRKQLPKWMPLVVLLVRAGADDDLVLQVVDAGADLNATGYNYDYPDPDTERILTPLQASLAFGRERLARDLIRRGADVHASAFQKQGLTALQAACYHGVSIHFLEYLVTVLGVSVDEPPAKIRGLTGLCAAALKGSLRTLEFLLDHGADVNARSEWWVPFNPYTGSTGSDYGKQCFVRPLDHAVHAGKLDMVELLLKAGGRSGFAGLGGAMMIAKRRRQFAMLSVIRSWDEKHGRRILEEEALWQRQHPQEALMLSESADGP